ncbi:MAG: hypothetical protein QM756_46195 [Polyangiaceae bacterium]
MTLMLVASSSLSCARSADTDTSAHEVVQGSAGVAATSTSAATVRSQGALERRLLAFVEPLSAEVGDFALLPSPRSLGAAIADEDQPALLYTVGVIEGVAPGVSRVRWSSDERGQVPNALIIPIGKSSLAQLSSVVLAPLSGASGLGLGFVVRGGEPESPMVRALDTARAPTDPSEPERRLAPNAFRALRTAGEIGSPMACRRSGRVERFILLRAGSGISLGLGFAGQLEVLDAAQCRPLPLWPDLKAGDRVSVPLASVFVRANVERVDAAAGRVDVLADFAGQRRPLSFGFGSVATLLPP